MSPSVKATAQGPNRSTRRRIQRQLLETIFTSYGRLSSQSPKIVRLTDRVKVVRDIPYRRNGETHHRLDVYSPLGVKKPMPIMIYIHGGGFVMCSKETHQNVGYINANMGYLVFNLNYRLAPAHPFPAALEDVCKAYAWVIKQAYLFNGDVSRVTLAGESAGANLVLALTIAGCFRRHEDYAHTVWDTNIVPKAVQLHAGLLQVSQPDRFKSLPQAKILGLGPLSTDIAKGVAMAYLNNTASHPHPAAELADPLTIIENHTPSDRPLPPMFAAVGTADICQDDTHRLEKALIRRQVPHTINYYPHEMHAFHFLFWRNQARQFWQDSTAFLHNWV